MQALTLEDLKAKTAEFRGRLSRGATLADLLPEAFAVVREVSSRVLRLRHYDVQLVRPLSKGCAAVQYGPDRLRRYCCAVLRKVPDRMLCLRQLDVHLGRPASTAFATPGTLSHSRASISTRASTWSDCRSAGWCYRRAMWLKCGLGRARPWWQPCQPT